MINFKIELDKIVLHSHGIKYVSRGGRAMSYTTKEYKVFKRFIANSIPKQVKVIEGAVWLNISVVYPIPKSYKKSKKKLALTLGQPKTSIPDLDNIAKSIIDGLSGKLFEDDKQVTNLFLEKKYTDDLEQEKIIIEIECKELLRKEI